MSKFETVRLGDVATYINGYAFKPSDWSDTGLPIIRIQNLTGNDYETNYYSGDYDKKYEIVNGDILISWSASLGVYEWKKETALLNQHIFKVCFNKLEVYKSYFIHTVSYLLNDMVKETHGSTMKHITKPRFDNTPFPYPDLKTQRQIANTLDKVTHTINLCNAILEKLDLLVKSRFVEMFGEPISNSMGWERCELGACLESIDNGKSYVCDNDCRTGGNPAILKLSSVTYGIYKPDENKAMIDEDLFDESAEVKNNDLLFTRKNTPELVGMSAYVFNTPPKLMMPDLIFRLNAKASCNKIYLWQLINHDLFRPCIQNIANGSAKSMSNISKERLSKLTIPVPPLALQKQFAAFIERTDKSKLAVKQVLEKAETLKKALMQEYFG